MKQKKIIKVKKGISLIVLIITIIVVIILAAAVILSLSKDGGIINKARFAKDEYNKIEYRDRINEAYTIVKNKQEMQGKSDREIFEEVKKSLNFEKAKYEISDKSMNITTKEGYEYTLTGDGNIYDEKVAILDIADGNIDLYSNGYKQYTGALERLNKNGSTSFTGKYIITGTTTENVVRVCDVGNYNVIIKDLNIDCSSLNTGCPFNANAGKKATDCFVKITLEGSNYLQGKLAPGLSAGGGTPNVNGVVNGSSLTIDGNGSLETKGHTAGPYGQPGIGGQSDPSGFVSNIIINSGNIKATGISNCCGIGSGLRQNVNNIVINGGNIYSRGGNRFGIGADGIADNIIINGGIITALGGEYGGAIGGGATGSGTLLITGGNINAISNYRPSIGCCCKNVKIIGGTIISKSSGYVGISHEVGGNLTITGGNVLTKGKNYDIGLCHENKSYEIEKSNPIRRNQRFICDTYKITKCRRKCKNRKHNNK